MPAFPSRAVLAPGHRLALAVWLVLTLVWQPWVAAYQGTVAAAGIEVCTSAGMTRVDADGQPLGQSHKHAQDCCCHAGLAVALPPALPATLRLAAEAPATRLATSQLHAEWLAPLSRGPPLHA